MESRIEQHPEKTGIKKIIKDKFREYSVLVIIALLVLVLVIYAYFRFKGDADKTMWGLYGDYVGGFLGTIVAFLSVYYLVATLQNSNVRMLWFPKITKRLQRFTSPNSSIIQYFGKNIPY